MMHTATPNRAVGVLHVFHELHDRKLKERVAASYLQNVAEQYETATLRRYNVRV